MVAPLMLLFSLLTLPSSLIAMSWRDITINRLNAVENGEDSAILNEPISYEASCQKITPLRLACQFDADLRDKLLKAGADANAPDPIGRPLESAPSKEVVELLLNNGADPALCINSPLYGIFAHYTSMKKSKRTITKNDNQWFMHLLDTFTILLKHNANPNQFWYNNHPLKKIIDNQELDRSQKEILIRIMIAHGGNPQLPADAFSKQSLRAYAKNIWTDINCLTTWDDVIRISHKQALRNRAWLLLVAWHKNRENSIFGKLPKDMINLLIRTILES